ncbi:MAG: hypothetical protein LBB91_06820 [Clostridiales bacterium]|nr:hypothetical protein [Clostridiales bacterium]
MTTTQSRRKKGCEDGDERVFRGALIPMQEHRFLYQAGSCFFTTWGALYKYFSFATIIIDIFQHFFQTYFNIIFNDFPINWKNYAIRGWFYAATASRLKS